MTKEERISLNRQYAIKVRRELNSRDWFQGDLARKCGLHYTTISKVLKGSKDSNYSKIAKINQVFGWEIK